MNEHTCPVCGYDHLELPPRDYSICACCGTEFGYDDRVLSHAQLRRSWILRGYPWFDEAEPRPAAWDPIMQLVNAGHGTDALELVKTTAGSATPTLPLAQVRSPSIQPRVKYLIAQTAA